MESMDTPDVSRQWMDRLAIADLVVRFSDAVTRGDLDAFEALWVPDGVWEESAPVDMRIVGAAGDPGARRLHGHGRLLRADDPWRGRDPSRRGPRNVEDDSSSRLPASEDAGFTNLGIYYDELVKVDGQWKFARRRLENIYVETEPLTGTLATARTDIP